MKNINKILACSLLALTAASCADLDTEYQGYYVTPEQKQAVADFDPAKAQAAITGCFANFNVIAAVSDDHWDFGWPAIMMGLDLQALDVQCKYTGYNWHLFFERYDSRNLDGEATAAMWKTMYNQIFTANAAIAGIDPETTEPTQMFYLAQAHALRAYDYFQLAQSYAFNYDGHQSDPCVPIITNLNSDEIAKKGGAPRNTVAEVYEQIYADIDHAIELLNATNIKPQNVISSKPKRMMSVAAAYGLRARINLVCHKYAEAASDAQMAISNFNGRPYSLEEVSRPAMNSLEDPAWMWGVAIAETDRVVTTGIVNWPSFMVSFSDGYVTAGAWKYCGYQLWSYIPNSDVRKGWFLDDNYQSPNLTEAETDYLAEYIGTPNYYNADNTTILFPQTNVKFATYQNVMLQNINANDIPLMRIEEMYLTLAEALGMNGELAAGKSTLEQFVKTYRNPKYTCTASTVEDFQTECWMQRRLELWGEGLSFFDIMRLNKGVDRLGNRTCYRYRFNIPAGDPALIYCVPRSEVNANPFISVDDAGTTVNAVLPILEPGLDQ